MASGSQSFTEAVVATIEHKENAAEISRESSLAIFNDLRKACLHVSKSPEALSCSDVDPSLQLKYRQAGGVEAEVLAFLLDFAEANAIRKKQVIEVVEKLLRAPNWAVCVDQSEDIYAGVQALLGTADVDEVSMGMEAPGVTDLPTEDPAVTDMPFFECASDTESASNVACLDCELRSCQWMYADYGPRQPLAWKNPARWSRIFSLEQLVANLTAANSRQRPFFVYLVFSGGRNGWIKYPEGFEPDGVKELVEMKRLAVAENREAVQTKEGESCSLPDGAQVCRAWYGRAGFQAGPLGADVTEKVRELLQVSELGGQGSLVFATNANFGDPRPYEKKVLVVEYRLAYPVDASGTCL